MNSNVTDNYELFVVKTELLSKNDTMLPIKVELKPSYLKLLHAISQNMIKICS